MTRKLRDAFAFVAFTLVLVWCIPSLGQVIKGSIKGTVADSQGAVVPGAQVKAKNPETGAVLTTATDGSGQFQFNLIPTGTYTIEVQAKGFKTASQANLIVDAGRETSVGTLRLAVGDTGQTIEVTGDAPLIDTTQAQVSNTFAGTTLNTFAGIQENQGLDRLALFVPGVVGSRSDNFSNTNGGGFSSNGLRGRNNDQEIDGQNNNDNSVGGPGLFLSNPNFVQQYVIITNNFGPEYGRNSGSVVNIITKSGTNAWHGNVYGEENNSFLNALSNTQRNSFQPGKFGPTGLANVPFSGPPRSNNEFSGGGIGGPIVKNKWFVFGGFDDQIIAQNTVYTTTNLTPTPAGLATLAACFPTSSSLAALASFGPYGISAGNPQPRNIVTPIAGQRGFVTGCAGVQEGGVTRILPTPVHGFDFVNRVDGQLGSNDSLLGRYLFNRGNNFNTQDNGAAGYVINVLALSSSALISETHNFNSHMVNEARGAFGRLNVVFGGNSIGNSLEPPTASIVHAGANISMPTGILGFGPANNLPQGRLVNTWQGQDNFNYVRGKHSLKAGVNWTYQRSPNTFLPAINGIYTYANTAAITGPPAIPAITAFGHFFTNTPQAVQVGNGNPVSDFREYDTFFYGGDDWKLTQNLTLNLGLTWSYYGQPANLFHDNTVKQQTGPSPFWNPALPLAVTTFPSIPAPKNSFGPSAGFAYSPQWGGFMTGHGKTVIRGGYRLLYDPAFYNIYLNIMSSTPNVFNYSLLPAQLANPALVTLPAVPNGDNVRAALKPALQLGVFDPRTFNETTVAPDFKPDRVHAWTFGFERELSKSAVVEVRYSGNKGTNLFQSINGNPYVGTAAAPGLAQLFPQLVPAGVTGCTAPQLVLGPGQTSNSALGREFCDQGVVRVRTNTSYSDYHALQTELRTNNLFKQLTMQASYTWSKTTDNVSEIFGTNTAGNNIAFAQNPFDFKTGEHSVSGINIPNAFTVLAIEQLPFMKEQHGLLGHILGGWTLSGAYVYGSGQPYTPEQANDARGFAGAANLYDNAFVNAFVSGGIDSARPFLGNPNAPVTAVGVYCGDSAFVAGFSCPAGMPSTQLVSLTVFNQTKSTIPGFIVPVSSNDVRYIINSKTSQAVFGTPFGNSPRNNAVDAPSNRLDGTIYKTIKLSERTSLEIHLTAINALNHFNFVNVDAFLDDAGNSALGNGFGKPELSAANGRQVFVGGKISF